MKNIFNFWTYSLNTPQKFIILILTAVVLTAICTNSLYYMFQP